jgi:hypothetical protein
MEMPQDQQQDLFQEGIANLLMATEELRQQLVRQTPASSATQILQWRHALEGILHGLSQLQPTNDLESDLRKNCKQRAAQVALQALRSAKTKPEIDSLEAQPELERDCQGAVARMAELSLMLCQQQQQQQQKDEIVDLYVQYQRDVIRQRAKPAIARLVAYRNNNLQEEDEEERQKAQHSHVVTTILGQASALIHPLILWKSHLPPSGSGELTHLHDLCDKSISILDEQAQALTQRVTTWCLEDLKVDDWIGKSANEESCQNVALGELDAVVEEVAFICQVLDRYLALMKDCSNTQTTLKQLHPEWTWKYASLERYLTTQQWQSALALANPVQIVMGTPIQVPSVVEDAQYLSTRGLQRAASTRSAQAIGTVAHSIASDVWSTDMTGGVHQALLDQKGCWEEPEAPKKKDTGANSPTKPSSSAFAAALMDALDDDLATKKGSASSSSSMKNNNKPPSAPSSSGILGSLSSLGGGGGDKLLRIRLDTHLCALNGIYSASAACTSLVKFLDSLHEDKADDEQHQSPIDNMTQLAREELFRYANDYTKLLHAQVGRAVTEFCGTPHDAAVYKGPCCLPILKYYLEREEYQLSNAKELQAQEDDARLHQQWIQPLQESKLLSQLNKSEPNVMQVIHEALAGVLVELILNGILSSKKRFTDWGSLLLSKQVRLVQQHVSQLFLTSELPPTTPREWEKLSQAVTVLQLEKPSDWSLFYQATSVLSVEELERILKLRVDFSSDAVAAVVTSVRKQATASS